MRHVLVAILVAGAAVLASAQDNTKKEVERPVQKQVKADAGKSRVETPLKKELEAELVEKLKRMLDDVKKNDERADKGKMVVELPVKKAIEESGVLPAGKVAPGKVTWHASFEAAKAASTKSGKPVLLFQLLGSLEDEFC